MKTIIDRISNGKRVEVVIDDTGEVVARVGGQVVGTGNPLLMEPVKINGTLRTHHIGKLGLTLDDALLILREVKSSQPQPQLTELDKLMIEYERLVEVVRSLHLDYQEELREGIETSRFSSKIQSLQEKESEARSTLNSFLTSHPEVREELDARKRELAERSQWN